MRMVGSLLFGIGVVSIAGFTIYFSYLSFVRHENDHARDVRRETEESRFSLDIRTRVHSPY